VAGHGPRKRSSTPLQKSPYHSARSGCYSFCRNIPPRQRRRHHRPAPGCSGRRKSYRSRERKVRELPGSVQNLRTFCHATASVCNNSCYRVAACSCSTSRTMSFRRGAVVAGPARLRQDWPSECSHHAGSAADLLHDPLQRVVGPDFSPVNIRKGVVGQASRGRPAPRGRQPCPSWLPAAHQRPPSPCCRRRSRLSCAWMALSMWLTNIENAAISERTRPPARTSKKTMPRRAIICCIRHQVTSPAACLETDAHFF